jgi:hypothetical protein
MDTFQFNHGSDRTILFHGRLPDFTAEIFMTNYLKAFILKPVLKYAGEPSIAGYGFAVNYHLPDQDTSPAGQPAGQGSRVDFNSLFVLCNLNPPETFTRFTRDQFHRAGLVRACNGGTTQPFNRTVRPIGEWPGLEQHRFSILRQEQKVLIYRQAALPPWYSPADPRFNLRMVPSKPVHPYGICYLNGMKQGAGNTPDDDQYISPEHNFKY